MHYQRLDKFKVPKGFRGKPAWIVQLWLFVQYFFFKTSPQFMYGWRRFLLRMFGANIGKGVIIRPTASIQFPWKLTINDYSWIGDNVVLYNLGQISIGKNTVISQKCYLCTGSHDYLIEDFPIISKPIIVEDECWLATDVYLSPGVTIGRGTIIAARSSVYRSLPAGKICMGNPAVVIKDRTKPTP